MKTQELVLPLIAGGAGAIAGYIVRGTVFVYQDYDAIRPRIDLKRTADGVVITPSTPINMLQQYTATFMNYPPNTQLVAFQIMQETGAAPYVVGVGVTDSNGRLVVTGSPVGVGTYYVHAWDGPTGKYIAIAALFVIPA